MNFITKLFKPKMLALGLTMAIAGLVGFNTLAQSTVKSATLPTDCEPNSIIYCGVQSASEFRDKYNNDPTAKKDLKTLYAANLNNTTNGGMTPEKIERFANEAVRGWAYRNGDVKLMDDTLVMTNAWSLGREQQGKPGRTPITIGTETYFKSILDVGFGPKTQRIPAFIMFNNEGEVEFAVMNSCSNPLWGDDKKLFKCENLKSEQIDRTTFKFTTETYDRDGANITKVEYDFGDGNKQEVSNKNEKFAYTHSYATPGNYTVKVKVTVVIGDKTKTFESEYCVTQVEVKAEPIFKCETLTPKLISGKRKYAFELVATAKNGAKLTKVDFDFGDGQTAKNIKPAVETGTILVKVDHEYAAKLTGKQTIEATLYFNSEGAAKDAKCKTEINLTDMTCEDYPTKPKECEPVIEECLPGIPKGSPECTPKEIVKTGPAEIAMSALGLGSVAGAGMYYRASRKNFLDKIFKR